MQAWNKLSPGQAKVVQEVEQQLTTPQCEMIEKHAHVVGVPHSFRFGRPRDDDNMLQGEGPSKGKGKGLDPGNWGGIDFTNEDIDLDAQRTALETWKTVQEWVCSQSDIPWIEELPNNNTGKAYGHATSRASVPAGPPVVPEAVKHIDSCQGNVKSSSEDTETSKEVTSKKHKKRTHKRKDRTKRVKETKEACELPAGIGHADPVRVLVDKTVTQPGMHRERQATPRAMEPVEQINLKSYIGLALNQLNKGKCTNRDQESLDDLSGSSSTSLSGTMDSENLSKPSMSDSDDLSDSSKSSSREWHGCRDRKRG